MVLDLLECDLSVVRKQQMGRSALHCRINWDVCWNPQGPGGNGWMGSLTWTLNTQENEQGEQRLTGVSKNRVDNNRTRREQGKGKQASVGCAVASSDQVSD